MRLTRRERFMRIPARYSLVGSVSDLTENGFVRSARIETQPYERRVGDAGQE